MPPSVVADADVAFALLIHETTSLGGRSGRRQTSHRPDGDLVSPIVMYRSVSQAGAWDPTCVLCDNGAVREPEARRYEH